MIHLPLDIPDKEDDYFKKQAEKHVDPRFFISANEFMLLRDAINYLYDTIGNSNKFLGTFADLPALIAAHPVGEESEFAFINEDDQGNPGVFEYRWNVVNESWEIESGTGPTAPVYMKVKAEPFAGIASLSFAFSWRDFKVTSIAGGGIYLELKTPLEYSEASGTDVNLRLPGVLMNQQSPSTASTFDVKSVVLGGQAESAISTAGKTQFPDVVQSATPAVTLEEIDGSDFEPDAVFDLVFRANTATNVQYFFIKR